MKHLGKLPWIWVSILVIIIDQYTKYLTVTYLPFERLVDVIPNFFGWYHAYNYGAAWSFLADHSGWQKWLFAIIAIVVSLVLIVWLMRLKHSKETWLAIGIALVLGGALGNLYDRLVHDYVIDFVCAHWYDIYYFPSFNIADTGICIGAFMLIVDMVIFAKRREK